MTSIDLGRPVQGDVVELILEDHRRFESLLRDLRDSSSDRDAVRQAFSALHVAHAEAEEKYVYPKLRRKGAVSADEAEHGEEEHAEGNEALLAVLELAGTDTQAFDDAVEELAKVVNHHLTEEELTILNPAREEVGPQVREPTSASSSPTSETPSSTTTAARSPTSAGSSPRRARRACSTTRRTTSSRHSSGSASSSLGVRPVAIRIQVGRCRSEGGRCPARST